MRRWIAALLLTASCGALEAALPLALLGKQIIQSLVESLVEDAIHASLRALLGPCDGALASAALTNVQAIVGSRGAVPAMPAGIPALPAGMAGAAGASPSGGAAAGALTGVGTAIAGPEVLQGVLGDVPASTLSSLGLSDGAGGFSAQVRQMIEKAREEEMRERRADQHKRGLTPAQIEAEDRQIAKEQLREAEEMVAMLRESKPLSSAEVDEFVAIYERFAKLAPDSAQCSPESLRRVLAPAMVMPMTAGPVRMMLRSFRELDKEMSEARRTFAAMTPEDRADFVRQMSDQIEDWSEADRQVFASLLRANPFDMPLPLRDDLLKRLN
jgi:hypothetical protein